MSLIPTIYSSSDPGAPVLMGQAGSLAALLDAVLVDGYGTGPTAKAPLGWTRVYAASNKRVFRGDLATATGCLVRIDDTNARYAWVTAYSTMSDIDTGTDQAPPIDVRPSGELWPKSSTADTTARFWWAIGNERCLYIWMAAAGPGTGATGHDGAAPFFFGDLVSNRPNDPYAFAISHTLLTSYTGTGGSSLSNLWGAGTGGTATPAAGNAAATIVRPMSSAPGSVYLQQSGVVARAGFPLGNGDIPYPIYESGPMVYERARVWEPGPLPRGHFPGVFAHWHARPFNDLQAVAGLLNKAFHSGSPSTSTGRGQIFFETDKEWL